MFSKFALIDCLRRPMTTKNCSSCLRLRPVRQPRIFACLFTSISAVRFDNHESSTTASSLKPDKLPGTNRYFPNYRFGGDGSSSIPEPPKPPKNFHETYLRRPLFGVAGPGNMVFRERNRVLITVVLVTGLLVLIFSGYFYYHANYVLDPVERRRMHEQSSYGKGIDPEYSAIRAELETFSVFSDIARFATRDSGWLGTGDDHTDQRELWSVNPDDIVDPIQVLPREQTGRKTKLSLRDFDEMLRSESSNQSETSKAATSEKINVQNDQKSQKGK